MRFFSQFGLERRMDKACYCGVNDKMTLPLRGFNDEMTCDLHPVIKARQRRVIEAAPRQSHLSSTTTGQAPLIVRPCANVPHMQ
jgi:hypothetical protein